MRCERETPHRKQKEASTGCVREPPPPPPDKNEASTGCVRETPQIKMKPAWDV